jgi:hypothetical protein
MSAQKKNRWFRCRVCDDWISLDFHVDGVDYMTFYGTPTDRHRVELNGKQPYASVGCLCLTCIRALAELVE